MSDLIDNLKAQLSGTDFGTLWTQWWPYVLGSLAAIVALWLVVRLVARGRREKAAENARAEDNADMVGNGDLLADPDEGIFGSLTPALAAQIPESKKESEDFAKLLRQAGMYSPGAGTSIYALRFALLFGMLVITGLAALVAPQAYSWPILIVGGLLAGFLSIIPRLYVFFRRRARAIQIRNGLADMMDMLSMCMGGGLALSPSLDHVARNLVAHPELARELQILRRQAEVGSVKQSLRNFAARLDMPEVRQVAYLLSRGDRLGMQMSSPLLNQADHLRTHRKQLATMQANKTPIKLTIPLLLCFAPAALILLISPAFLELQGYFARDRQYQSIRNQNGTLVTPQIGPQLSDEETEFDPTRP